ncbi:isoprenoid synthase domain-containing protein [Rhodocollybia butyracea]|uniref:Terpene synthase n=1 Tax=Rhodocollybia butyracea TaxID=206335 RepID=A0A9P5PJM4_9AGAR|nr:isoprenoid synthase domain-containing protein [Rhodocollybia butyracea]
MEPSPVPLNLALNLGKISPFPPKAGQPYPPARNHPRWKEIYKLHDNFLMKEWPFESKKDRDMVPSRNYAGFATWCVPSADFDRMVWAGRITGIFFVLDDYVDNDKDLSKIPAFKQAAEVPGLENLLHPEDKAEIAYHNIFAEIKRDVPPDIFKQLTKLTSDWWDSHQHGRFKTFDDYSNIRRVDTGILMSHAWFRYTLGINLSDEEVFHPLMCEAEGIVSDHIGLVNDYISYLKERVSNTDDRNIIRILMDQQGCNYNEAVKIVVEKIREKEKNFIIAGLAVINDPILGKNPEVHRWVSNLPYVMGGHHAWGQTSSRYIVENKCEVALPSLDYAAEETPTDDRVDN